MGTAVRRATINGLLPGVRYWLTLVARSNAGDGPAATTEVTTYSTQHAQAPGSSSMSLPAASPPALQPVQPPPSPAAQAAAEVQYQQPQKLTPSPAAQAAAEVQYQQPQKLPPSPAAQAAAEVQYQQPQKLPPAAPATSNHNCRADVEPAPPQAFTAMPLSKDKINLSWQNGDFGICTDIFRIDAYQLKTGDRVIGAQTGGIPGKLRSQVWFQRAEHATCASVLGHPLYTGSIIQLCMGACSCSTCYICRTPIATSQAAGVLLIFG